MAIYVIVQIESYEGEDTFVRCGDDSQAHLFCVVKVHDDNSAAVVDSSYRTYEEAAAAWPDAAIRPSKSK